ncbi:MAG: hypothetical protein U9P80_00630 [Thermodesulfobacteriota bacterium]|nr:hypothetical protein [Thermodesulfobacteriota bacterium]
MLYSKEQRRFERIGLSQIDASIDIKGAPKHVNIVNATEDGVCISGPELSSGSVICLNIQKYDTVPPEEISLYCRAIWTQAEGNSHRYSGLSFLQTNRILFKKDLNSFIDLVETARGSNGI